MKPPTIGEVRTYWLEMKLAGTDEEFYDHFESNGWMVGRAPMKNWQAAARNWSRNESKFGSAKVSHRQPTSTEVSQFNKLMAGKDTVSYFKAYRQKFGCDPEGI